MFLTSTSAGDERDVAGGAQTWGCCQRQSRLRPGAVRWGCLVRLLSSFCWFVFFLNHLKISLQQCLGVLDCADWQSGKPVSGRSFPWVELGSSGDTVTLFLAQQSQRSERRARGAGASPAFPDPAPQARAVPSVLCGHCAGGSQSVAWVENGETKGLALRENPDVQLPSAAERIRPTLRSCREALVCREGASTHLLARSCSLGIFPPLPGRDSPAPRAAWAVPCPARSVGPPGTSAWGARRDEGLSQRPWPGPAGAGFPWSRSSLRKVPCLQLGVERRLGLGPWGCHHLQLSSSENPR